MKPNIYEQGLDANAANFVPLSPLSFLERSAHVFPDRVAVIYGPRQQTWRDTYQRCRRLASALSRHGVGRGDTVAAMLPNVPAMYEAHFGVPMTGAVLNTLNTRLDAEAIAFMLDHGQAKVLLTDREFSATIEKALTLVKHKPLVIDVEDETYSGGKALGEVGYEDFIAGGDDTATNATATFNIGIALRWLDMSDGFVAVQGSHPTQVAWLTGAPNPASSGFRNTISLDQVVAGRLAPVIGAIEDHVRLARRADMARAGRSGGA